MEERGGAAVPPLWVGRPAAENMCRKGRAQDLGHWEADSLPFGQGFWATRLQLRRQLSSEGKAKDASTLSGHLSLHKICSLALAVLSKPCWIVPSGARCPPHACTSCIRRPPPGTPPPIPSGNMACLLAQGPLFQAGHPQPLGRAPSQETSSSSSAPPPTPGAASPTQPATPDGRWQALLSAAAMEVAGPVPAAEPGQHFPQQPAARQAAGKHPAATARRGVSAPGVQHAPLKASSHSRHGGHGFTITTGVANAVVKGWACSFAALQRPPAAPGGPLWRQHSAAQRELARSGSSGGSSEHTTTAAPPVRTPNPSVELPAMAAACLGAGGSPTSASVAEAVQHWQQQQLQQQAPAPHQQQQSALATGGERTGPARQAQGLLRAVLRRAALRRCQVALKQHLQGRREAAAAAAAAAVDGSSSPVAGWPAPNSSAGMRLEPPGRVAPPRAGALSATAHASRASLQQLLGAQHVAVQQRQHQQQIEQQKQQTRVLLGMLWAYTVGLQEARRIQAVRQFLAHF
ncbi:hypothetical protein ABPG75_009991 [Micractinium tetrahymenae]